MKHLMQKNIIVILFLMIFSASIKTQTGQSFDLTHNIISSGGGSDSTGGNFTLDGTAGQPSAGTVSTGSNFNLRGGFWAFDQLAPTAALVTISGQVKTSNGHGIKDIFIKLSDSRGGVRFIRTGTFGYFRFVEVEAGQVYILEVINRKQYTFSNPTRVLNVQEDITNEDIYADQ